MKGVLACAVAAGCVLALAPAAAAKPSADVSSLRPVNKQGQLVQRVARGRQVTVIIGFRLADTPRRGKYRVRVSYTLRSPKDVLTVRSSRAPLVYTGMYRFRMPLTVPKRFATGPYQLRARVEVLDTKKRVVASDWRGRTLRVR